MSNPSNSLLIIAGETSGDLHGARVLQALREKHPHVSFFGIGGQRMAAQGQEQFYTTKEMALIGFTEVIRHLPFLLRVFRHLEEEILKRKPDCAVLIDYPGFNLRLAKTLKKHGVPIVWYIAPQVWAWHASRVHKMARLLDHLAVVFPFEVPFFENAGLPTTFVGHPLLEVLHPEYERQQFFEKFNLNTDNKILALLPGSRRQEVMRLLPDMLATAAQIKSRFNDVQIVIAQSPDLDTSIYEDHLQHIKLDDVKLIQNATYSIMDYSDACIVASGTATLETGCFATPLAVVYRVSPMTYAIGKRLVKLKNIGLINIVAEEEIVPEFVQHEFTPENVANYISRLFEEPEYAAAIKAKLQRVREKLGEHGAAQRVAELVSGEAWGN